MALHTGRAANPEQNGHDWCFLARSEVCKPMSLGEHREPFLKAEWVSLAVLEEPRLSNPEVIFSLVYLSCSWVEGEPPLSILAAPSLSSEEQQLSEDLSLLLQWQQSWAGFLGFSANAV